MDFELTEEQRMVRDMARDFAQAELAPRARKHDLECKIDPEDIEEYIGVGGYQALATVMSEASPDAVIKRLEVSGLLGRGGAGFPTWKKWNFSPALPWSLTGKGIALIS